MHPSDIGGPGLHWSCQDGLGQDLRLCPAHSGAAERRASEPLRPGADAHARVGLSNLRAVSCGWTGDGGARMCCLWRHRPNGREPEAYAATAHRGGHARPSRGSPNRLRHLLLRQSEVFGCWRSGSHAERRLWREPIHHWALFAKDKAKPFLFRNHEGLHKGVQHISHCQRCKFYEYPVEWY